MTLKCLTIVLLCTSAVYAQQKCCSGLENVVRIGRCKDGSNITGITCERRYAIRPEENTKFNADLNKRLIDEGILTEVDNYCLTKEFETGDEIALVCFPEDDYREGSSVMLIFTTVCSILSILFLTATIIVYILVPKLRDLQGKCLLHLMIALAIALVLLCIVQFVEFTSSHVCSAVGYLTFASFLVTFTWLNIISFHIWRTTVIPNALGTNRHWYKIYCIYGYGLPGILVLSSVIAHHAPGDHIKPGIGYYSCWFSSADALWAYFYGPISFLLIANIIFFVWTMIKLWKNISASDNNSSKIKSLRSKCVLYIKLFFVMGLSWIFEVLSFAFDVEDHFTHYVWMITDFVNVLQGVLIFLILVAFRKKALRGLANQNLGCIRLPSQWKTLEDEEVDDDTTED